jgi:hypothetical protein
MVMILLGGIVGMVELPAGVPEVAAGHRDDGAHDDEEAGYCCEAVP